MGDYRWWRGRRADVAVAGAAFAVDLADLLIRAAGEVSAVRLLGSAGGLVVAAAALLVRRRRPVPTVVVAVAADVLLGLLAGPQTGFVGTVSLAALYSAGRYLPVARGWAVGVGAVALLAVPAATQAGPGAAAGELPGTFLVVVAGQLVAARAELTRHRRAVAVDTAVRSERRRMARELHDVVAHHIGVMSALIGAARTTMPRDPVRSRAALAAAERTAREAMVEMREMLALLRSGDPGGPGAGPAATAVGVAELVRRVAETGVRVSLETTGPARPLPPAVDRAVYRVTQEALTNVRRHAGDAAVTVRLRYGPESVAVEVVDDGGPQAASAAGTAAPGGGSGLAGMAERVALCGGTVEAAPRPGGGFRVAALIPLPAAAAGHGPR